ncbi:hypothetical protein CYMTET_28867 [Cymbomonas tetramitiformis]|uniref:Uncharacterized protein n=1 Tax=Cymbomonas tetramitiformis TaxID=36881 RepID=A0AAE0FLY7_9CHLO|nr:hypothetical protein CYMTET_28867 [Cymbomonas tetramitiformis]
MLGGNATGEVVTGDAGRRCEMRVSGVEDVRRAPKEVRAWFGLDEEFNLMMADGTLEENSMKPFWMTDEQMALAPKEVRHYFGRDELDADNTMRSRKSILGEESINPYYRSGARLNRAPTNLRQWFGVDSDFNLMMGDSEDAEEMANPLFTQAAKLTRAPTKLHHQFHPVFQRQSSQYNIIMGGSEEAEVDMASNPLYDARAKYQEAPAQLAETFENPEDYQERHAKMMAKMKPRKRLLSRVSALDFDALEKGLKHIAEEEEDVKWSDTDAAKAKDVRKSRRGSVSNLAHATGKMFRRASAFGGLAAVSEDETSTEMKNISDQELASRDPASPIASPLTLKANSTNNFKWVQGEDGGRYLLNAESTAQDSPQKNAGKKPTVAKRSRQSILASTGRRMSTLFQKATGPPAADNAPTDAADDASFDNPLTSGAQ